jgi:hypothetical protein
MPKIDPLRAEKRAKVLASIPKNASDDLELNPRQVAAVRGVSLSSVMRDQSLQWIRYNHRILRLTLGQARGKAATT